MTTYIKVTEDDFNVATEYPLLASEPSCGAVVVFTGLVRELANGTLNAMTLEHYPGMTETALQDIVVQARKRWALGPVRVIHRVGKLSLNEQIVFVGVASAHRKDAFAGAQFIMDYLKTKAPFWKQEHTSEGSYWVAAKESDGQAAQLWEQGE